jgi:tetratricopeptide (TPR) repeat protein
VPYAPSCLATRQKKKIDQSAMTMMTNPHLRRQQKHHQTGLGKSNRKRQRRQNNLSTTSVVTAVAFVANLITSTSTATAAAAAGSAAKSLLMAPRPIPTPSTATPSSVLVFDHDDDGNESSSSSSSGSSSPPRQNLRGGGIGRGSRAGVGLGLSGDNNNESFLHLLSSSSSSLSSSSLSSHSIYNYHHDHITSPLQQQQQHLFDDESDNGAKDWIQNERIVQQQESQQRRKLSTETTTTTTTTTSHSQEQNDQDDDEDEDEDGVYSYHVENSWSFQIVFGVLLGLIFVVRCLVCCLLMRYRKHANLQLAQPIVLTVLVFSGSISIMSCFFMIQNDSDSIHRYSLDSLFCLLRDAFILTPLTFAGNILLSRLWRISLLLSPIWDVGKDGAGGTALHDDSDDVQQTYGERAKRYILFQLTRLADVYDWIIAARGSCSKGRNHHVRRMGNKWKKTVPLQQLFLLTFLLTLPQLILQILNLTVPGLQQNLVPIIKEYGGTFVEERHICKADVGDWPSFLGIALTLLPYILTAIISWYSVEDFPQVFNEAGAYTQSVKVIVLVVAICLPPLVFNSRTNNPDSIVYLASMLVFALAMPPCWFLVYPKLWQVMTDPEAGMSNNRSMRRLLRKKPPKATVMSMADRQDHGKSAKLALTIGKMYEEMGMAQKSIDLFDEAIGVWQSDPNRNNKEKVGGFTLDEINSFSVVDLDNIIQLLIAKGRVNGTYQVADASGQKHAAHAWLDALEVFEKAPARLQMDDRSRKTLFPVFSGVWVFIKGGKIDAKSSLELNIARTFLRESKLNGDPVHYMRALAMMAEVEANRKGMGTKKFAKALDNFDKLKDVYDVDEHHSDVCAEYGTDRAGQTWSNSCLWLVQIGGKDDIVEERCEHILDQLIPFMDPENVLNMFEMLLPVIYVYKLKGETKRVEQALHTYVIKNFQTYFESKGKFTPCEPVLKPMAMLLAICNNPDNFPDFDDAVEWMVQDDTGVASDFLDNIYSKLCWSMLSLTAELCLRLAHRLMAKNGAMNDVHILVEKGLRLAKRAEKTLTDKKGHVILPIAYALHGPVYSELNALASRMGISTNHMDESQKTLHTRSSNSSSALDPHNLPSSYFKARTGSSHGSLHGSMSSDSKLSNGEGHPIRPSAVMIARFESNPGSIHGSNSSGGGSVSSGGGGGTEEESITLSMPLSTIRLESLDETLENIDYQDEKDGDLAGTETTVETH